MFFNVVFLFVLGTPDVLSMTVLLCESQVSFIPMVGYSVSQTHLNNLYLSCLLLINFYCKSQKSMIIAHISDLLSNPTICESLVTTGAGRRHQFNLE